MRFKYLFHLFALSVGVLLAGCAGWFAPPPGVGREVSFDRLPGWEQDRHASAWPALLRSCDKLAGRDAAWMEVCRAARERETPDDAGARAFFEEHFRVHRVNGEGRRDGLITGYYEPVLMGSFERDARFRFPLYRRPDDLLIVDLAGLYPELKGRRGARPASGQPRGALSQPRRDRARPEPAGRQ